MKYVLLCDENPLEYVQGRHKIEYVLDNIPSDEIFIIYHIFLNQSDFQEILINKCKTKKIHFSQIDYQTRGVVETAFIGIRSFIDRLRDDQITIMDIHDKSTIEYPFDNVKKFLSDAKTLLDTNTFGFKDSGYDRVVSKNIVFQNKLRICFDLDNTLTTYPTIAGDYTTVKPIYKNITLLKKLKSDGHEIIIYTARRMKTHHGNIGKVIKDIASVTIDTLEKFNIEYDELIFGKPIADIYIDDRAINPYINDVSYFGLFYDKETDTDTNETIDTDQYIPNKIRNNKFNKIRRCDTTSVIKTGPVNILKGELYYYQNIPSGFEDYFPRLIDYTIDGETIHLKMDYIEGIPLYYLYKNCLLTHRHIDDLFDIMDRLHSHSLKEDTTTIIDCDNVKNNYVKKLKTRFNTQDYPFEDAEDVLHGIIEGIDTYFAPRISHVIHGDFWFSNIILDSKGSYKFLDMKGINDGILTLNGDIYYDYGKLYQSILGYDLVLNGDDNTHNAYIKDMKQYFLKKCCDKGLDIHFLTYVTKGLVFGTLPFISHYENDIKKNVWAFIKKIAYER
jgi:capsule biosynthesis phosphatase